ncbi:hypothetical protein AGABI2DRAFT_180194 [Agaricus bisporus var. bisporus H97]|uniref:hypothetical protein n=1 Tax=Agaricus bisporus var. bisporus (strain H97 / ATCC MYA-4626 / FGSC 10389) TaxID=936046 RepID=UPI00029F7F02|nr:hypothetical protein AGABI2DRAFT_180194 [Agaricus bisporus var. bisporus H97]EKV44789.1 hypothetical protein AGABI2DRAFT_180194 [Agaricus bisporus var. bisporus H97]
MSERSLHFPRFWRSGRPPSSKSDQADFSSAITVSSSPRSSQYGQAGSVAATSSISSDPAGHFTHDSQPVIPPIKPKSPIMPSRPGSLASVLPSQNTDFDRSQHQDLLVVPGRLPVTASQTSLLSQQSIPPLRQDGNSGTIYVQNTHESRNVSVQGDGNYVSYANNIVNSSNQFMEKLLEKTIPGAAFDSSARDPPPRCHPGTRLAVLARCLDFINNAIGAKKVRWVVGKAGVGKSAIMQNVADSSFSSEAPGASIFFSINGRNDGAKAIITLAYQLAASCEPYRALIEYEITRKPSLLQSSLSVQFKKFIIEPFANQSLLSSVDRVLIIVDGLDECDKSHTQRELLELIFDYCSAHASSPIVWIIASRPESHITSFFAQEDVKVVYEKEEILVDSDEARSDVEKFLRDELTKIQHEFSLNPWSQWPPEHNLWKLANASGGLFVFADTIIKYIGDRECGNPNLQLNDVLKAIDAHPLPGVSQEEHPMARLDALYAQILSKVSKRVMANTRKILLGLIWDSEAEEQLRKQNFIVFCNWLGMTCDDAYAAIRHLSAVLDAPPRYEAHASMLRSFHKSFIDYICDFNRSGFSPDIKYEAYLLEVQYTFRILEQAPDGIDFGDVDYAIQVSPGPAFSHMTVLARGPGTGDNIPLTWLVDEEINWDDNQTRFCMYKIAVSSVVEGIKQGEPAFCTKYCIRFITSRFHQYFFDDFPFWELQKLVFEESRRHELLKHGILTQVPVKVLDYVNITWHVGLQLRRPTSPATKLSDSWDPSCKHKRAGNWREGKAEHWETQFSTMVGISSQCRACCIRLKRQLEGWKRRSPDHLTTVLFTSTGKSFLEFQFVDPDDGVSEWTYWIVYKMLKQERIKLGSTV